MRTSPSGGRVVVLNTMNLPLVKDVGLGADLVRIDAHSMCSRGLLMRLGIPGDVRTSCAATGGSRWSDVNNDIAARSSATWWSGGEDVGVEDGVGGGAAGVVQHDAGDGAAVPVQGARLGEVNR